MSDPRISVIMSNKNSIRTIRRCLEGVLNQEISPYEVIVVDAGSTDGSLDVIKSYDGKIKLISAPNCMIWEGQVIGIEAATGDFIAFTDPDMILSKNWLSCSMKWVGKGYPIVGGIRIDVGDKYNAGWNKDYSPEPWFEEKPESGLILSDLLLPKNLWYYMQKDKKFDYAYDVEIAFAANRLGIKYVITPEIIGFHDHPLYSYRNSFRKSMSYARRGLSMVKSNYGKPVIGGGTQINISIISLIKDITSINAVKGYQRNKINLETQGLDVGLPRFILSRFVYKLGQIVGVLYELVGLG